MWRLCSALTIMEQIRACSIFVVVVGYCMLDVLSDADVTESIVGLGGCRERTRMKV